MKVHEQEMSSPLFDNVENLKINKNTINNPTNFNNPALTSRVGIDETLDTSRGRSEKPNVTINNIAAAANIMGETERKSLKLAAVENECSEILPYLFVSGEAVARNLKLLQSKTQHQCHITELDHQKKGEYKNDNHKC